MKVKELIKKLQLYNPELDVCLFDWRKRLYHADEDYNSEGICLIDSIDIHDYTEEEAERMKRLCDINPKPFVSLSFINDDYDDDGILLVGD